MPAPMIAGSRLKTRMLSVPCTGPLLPKLTVSGLAVPGLMMLLMPVEPFSSARAKDSCKVRNFSLRSGSLTLLG